MGDAGSDNSHRQSTSNTTITKVKTSNLGASTGSGGGTANVYGLDLSHGDGSKIRDNTNNISLITSDPEIVKAAFQFAKDTTASSLAALGAVVDSSTESVGGAVSAVQSLGESAASGSLNIVTDKITKIALYAAVALVAFFLFRRK